MSRYFFYDNGDIPARYEETVPQVFPATAPGNFTWLPEIGHYVLTTFYPYQWDLNYRNPRVFNEMMYNFLFLANQGMDIIRIDAVPYIWKELGTSCRNLKEVHTIAAEVCAVHEGTIQTALIESVSEHDPSMVTGRLSNNLLVHIKGDKGMIGRLADVRLTECKGFYYMGELAE